MVGSLSQSIKIWLKYHKVFVTWCVNESLVASINNSPMFLPTLFFKGQRKIKRYKGILKVSSWKVVKTGFFCSIKIYFYSWSSLLNYQDSSIQKDKHCLTLTKQEIIFHSNKDGEGGLYRKYILPLTIMSTFYHNLDRHVASFFRFMLNR